MSVRRGCTQYPAGKDVSMRRLQVDKDPGLVDQLWQQYDALGQATGPLGQAAAAYIVGAALPKALRLAEEGAWRAWNTLRSAGRAIRRAFGASVAPKDEPVPGALALVLCGVVFQLFCIQCSARINLQ